jgi:2'-5' RNA ligase superfamily
MKPMRKSPSETSGFEAIDYKRRMARPNRAQVTLLLRDLPKVESLRAALDPAMATQIPAHVTAIYDDEAPDSDLLIARVREAASTIPPIELRLGENCGVRAARWGPIRHYQRERGPCSPALGRAAAAVHGERAQLLATRHDSSPPQRGRQQK